MNPYHYDEPVRRRPARVTDRLLAIAALILAALSLIVSLLT